MPITLKEIEAGRTARGGFTRMTLAAWGVEWPPTKGWRRRLIEGYYDSAHKQTTLADGFAAAAARIDAREASRAEMVAKMRADRS